VALGEFINDADMLGTSLFGYAKNAVNEVIVAGRAGALIDWEGEFENRGQTRPAANGQGAVVQN
jgi:hypothetical protein